MAFSFPFIGFCKGFSTCAMVIYLITPQDPAPPPPANHPSFFGFVWGPEGHQAYCVCVWWFLSAVLTLLPGQRWTADVRWIGASQLPEFSMNLNNVQDALTNFLLTLLMMHWWAVIRTWFGRSEHNHFNRLKSVRNSPQSESVTGGELYRGMGCKPDLTYSRPSTMWSIRLNASAENNDSFFVFLSGVIVII